MKYKTAPPIRARIIRPTTTSDGSRSTPSLCKKRLNPEISSYLPSSSFVGSPGLRKFVALGPMNVQNLSQCHTQGIVLNKVILYSKNVIYVLVKTA